MQELEKEDGELSDSDSSRPTCEEVYNPVMRPTSNLCQPRNVGQLIPSSDSDSSDSDPDFSSLRKRPRCQYEQGNVERNGHVKGGTLQKRKNNIWANVLQEEELTLEIGGVGLKKVVSDRSVESYDYTLAHESARKDDGTVEEEEAEEEEEEEGAFVEDDALKKAMRRQRFRFDPDSPNHSDPPPPANHWHQAVPRKKVTEGGRKKARHLAPIEPDPLWDNEQLGTAIADALFEQKPQLIVKVVEVLGWNKALDLYSETCRVEAHGGLMVQNGSRRRTSGGVFLFLLRSAPGVDAAHLARIFALDNDEQQQQQVARKRKRKRKKHDAAGGPRRRLPTPPLTASAPGDEGAKMDEEGLLHVKGLFCDDGDDPGGTKCPGSTPVTSPTHSDDDNDDAPLVAKGGVPLLPLKEVCEKAASEICLRDANGGRDDDEDDMDTTC